MLRRGEISNQLFQVAVSEADGEEPDYERSVEFMLTLAAATFVEPRVTLTEPGPGEIPADALSDEDLVFVSAWAQAPVADLATFRSDRTSPAGGSDGSEVRAEAVAADGDQ